MVVIGVTRAATIFAKGAGALGAGLSGAARLLARPFERRSAPTGLKSPADWLTTLFGGTSKSGAIVSEATAVNVSTVASCVNVLAQSIAMLPIKLLRKDGGSIAEATDHPANYAVRYQPNRLQSSYRWRAYLQTCLGLGGNGYGIVRRNGYFEPEAIEWVKPCDIAPMLVEPKKSQPARMVYRYQGETLQDYEVLHVRGLSTDGLVGASPISLLRESIGLSLTAQEFAARTFLNGNRRAGVFEGSPETTREKAQAWLDFWQANYGGAGNAGKTPVLFGGLSWKDAGFSSEDAELLLTRRFEVEQIAGFYRVPLHLLNTTEKATTWGSGIEQLNRGFVDYTLAPWLANWEEELDRTLLTRKEQEGGYFFKFNVGALLRGSPEQRAKFYEIMRRIAAMDVNQIRELEDFDLYPDAWAGDPRMPLNAQASGQGEPEPAPARAAQDS